MDLSEEDIIINDQDGLPNIHPNLLAEAEIFSSGHASDDEFEDLPASLIVTNLQDSVFTSSGELLINFIIHSIIYFLSLLSKLFVHNPQL